MSATTNGSNGPAHTAVQRVPGRNGGTLTPWVKGQSGNAAGRKTAGATYAEWLNVMAEWSKADVQAVIDADERGDDVPNAKAIAAASIMRARDRGYFNATPLAANDLDRICDRTEGKPTQRVEVSKVERSPEAVLSDLAALLQQFPELATADMPALPPADA